LGGVLGVCAVWADSGIEIKLNSAITNKMDLRTRFVFIFAIVMATAIIDGSATPWP
jgi:hypothetical protein